MTVLPVVLTTPDGRVEMTRAASGRTRITLVPRDPALYVPRRTCETSRPEEVDLFLEFGSYAWLCDAIARHEEPEEVQGVLRRQLAAYLKPEALSGARMLDFGCGTGASTYSMAELLPDTEIIGLELDRASIELARRIAARRGRANVSFLLSPSGESVPLGLESVDFIMLSAVYEHLLPSERRVVMPRLWTLLKPGGVLFVNQTPHRWAPYEHHSTGLWGINYLPDRLAHWYARRCSKMNPHINRSADWNTHLRGGLRGGTELGIIADLTAEDRSHGAVLQPTLGGFRDRADYWLAGTSPRFRVLKRAIASVFRICDRVLGTIPVLNVDVAIRKELPDALRAQSDGVPPA